MAEAAAAAARYGSLAYWRAAAPQALETPVEWYADYEALKPLLARQLAYGDNILVVGPGQSALHERLYESGFRGLTVADACEGVLQLWRARAADKGQAIKFEAADVVEGLDYAHFSYNATIDKGTLDCIQCRGGPQGAADARAALRSLHSALRSPGTLVLVSHAPPQLRLPLLKCCEWASIETKVLAPSALADAAAGRGGQGVIVDFDAARHGLSQAGDAAECYVYICKKPF